MEILISNLKNQIASGNLGIVLTKLIAYFGADPDKNEYLNRVISIQAALKKHNSSITEGILSYNEEVLGNNQIRKRLLDLLDSIYDENLKKDLPNNSMVGTNTITILFVTANPEQTASLRLEEEIRDIEEELRKAKFRDKFTIIRKDAARVQDLQDGLLDSSPDFIHFSGHGNKQGIILHGADNSNMTVNNESLAQLFKLFSKKLVCIFFSSCYSEIQGQMINQYIPNIIGMKDKVPQDTAISFAKAFYKSLGAGQDIEFSFEFAKTSVGLNNLTGENIPIFLQQED